ncbi:hypothetical protein DID80_02140 [Candidatus Marinamargulisbacteria bacterium SCGC AAA071-K20]|nr:hypothetical protein DID80_02140 [Candidatus Marinamargulisbacteria bacterium SCGC AAA071-K20]
MKNNSFRAIILSIIFLAFTVLFSPLYAQSSSVGTTAMDFLRLSHEVKADALGTALTAYQNHSAFTVNPSGLADKAPVIIKLHYLSHVESISFKNLKASLPFLKGNVGVSLGIIDYGSQARTTFTDQAGSASGDFSSKGHLLHLGYGMALGRVNMGASVHYLSQTLDTRTSTAMSTSVGTQVKIDDSLRAGMSLNNITLKKAQYIRNSAQLPQEFRTGLFYKGNIFEKKLGLGVDLVRAIDTDFTLAIGAELGIHRLVDLRLGYNTYSDINPFSMGLGMNLSKMLVDFTYKPSDLFGESYRVGFGYSL